MATINLKADDGSVAAITSRPPVVMKLDATMRGPQGVAGEAGATPALSIGTVTTLPAGSSASVTLAGTAEAPVLNFAVPRGVGDVVTYSVLVTANAQAGLGSSGLPALTGALNGSNTTFTTPEGEYLEGSLEVFLNGILQVSGEAITETTPASGIFDFVTAPEADDQVYVRYLPEEPTEVDGGAGVGDGLTEEYVENYVAAAFDDLIATYPDVPAVQAMLADRQTATQVNNAIAQYMVAYQANTAFKVKNGNDENYLQNTAPFGVDADWPAIGEVRVNANGALWFKSAVVAEQPDNPDPVEYDADGELILAAEGFEAMYVNAEGAPDSETTYDALVLADNPIAYLPLSSTSVVADMTGNGRTGTISGAPTATTLPNGDAALAFDGVDDYITVADHDSLSAAETGILTIEAWMRPDVIEFANAEGGPDNNNYVYFAGKGTTFGVSGNQEWACRMYSYTNTESRPNRISGYAFNPAGGLGAGSYFQDTVTAEAWIHYTFVINTVDTSVSYPTGYTRIYKNGVLRDTDSLSEYSIVPVNGDSPMRLGTSNLSSYFEGALAKVAIYDYEPTASTILSHYQAMVDTADQTTTSRAFADAMTMAVLARDREMYVKIRDAAKAKMQRANTFSGQTTMLYSFGSVYNITTNATTNWTVNTGDTLQILGAVIRAWNLWGMAIDRDLGSGLCYDIKNYMVNTDESRAYFLADTAQKTVTNGHHTFNGGTVWANEPGRISPVIFRMAKTFTGDAIFDQLVAGYYDLMGKAVDATTGFIPHYVGYQTSNHTTHAIVDGNNGWTATAVSDMDATGFEAIAHLHSDYKIFADSRALALLDGDLKTTLKAKYLADTEINTVYSLAGTAQNTFENAYTYRLVYLLLSISEPSTAATVKADKIPYPSATDVGDNHYFNDQITGVTPASTRDGDTRVWLAESRIAAIYPDLAQYGANPNAGTTAPTGTTPIDQGEDEETTPPDPDVGGVDVGAWYSYGAAPNLTETERKDIAKIEYDKFKALCFVNYHCNPDGTNQVALPNGQYRVMNPFDQFNGNQSGLRACVSEGIGYGMLATVFMGNPNLGATWRDTNAQTYFDGFWKYYKRYMNVRGLMNWCIRSNGDVNGTGGASDGDFDVAFALVMAHRVWGSAGAINYGTEATALINNIKNYEFVPLTGYGDQGNTMTNGDQWGFDNPTYFQDYFRPAWFREFYKHTGDTRWNDIIVKNYPIALGTFYNTGKETSNINGLTTDIQRNGNRAGSPIFGYNNIRYPFSIAADYIWNGPAADAMAYGMLNRLVTRAKVKYGTNPAPPRTPDPANPGQDLPLNPYAGNSGVTAEAAIDYTWWNGNYRNASYMQAHGVAGIVDAAHSQWAADCMEWLAADTEPNYFGRSLSCISTIMMAGIMNPGTPTTPGTTNPGGGTTTPTPTDPVVVTPPPTNTPVGSYTLYAHQGHQIHSYIAGLSAGTQKTRLSWVGSVPMAFWSGIEWDPNCDGAKAYMDLAAAQGRVGQVLSYSIPGRDLGLYSAGGAANRAAYETWIGKLATAIGNRQCIFAYEPDSLPGSDQLPQDLRVGRWSMMKWAVNHLKANCPNMWLYIDTGHPAWRSATDCANLLRQVGVEQANGFVVNVSNFRPDSECIAYGQQICAALNLPNARFVYDTSRNGGNPPEPYMWANPPGRQFGKYPQFGNTGIDKCDGWLWWKTPGESDGNNSDSWVGETAPTAGQLYPKFLYNTGVGDNVNTGVVATSSGLAQRPPTPGVAVSGP